MRALIGRERELDGLRARLAAAAAGDGSAVIIEGPVGIGKSRLVAELRAQAGPEVRVLAARSAQLERDFAFGVARQLLPAATFGPPSFATLDALSWHVRDLADDAPLLLVVDDVQWADGPSARFLAYLANRIDDARILLVATRRAEEPGTEVPLEAAATVTLGPLAAEAVGDVLTGRLHAVSPALVAAVVAATGGNPLFVDRVAQALEEAGTTDPDAVERVGPGAVARTVLARLAQLPDGALEVARAVAVLDVAAAPDAVAALAGVAPAAAARALAAAEILTGDEVLAFVHPLVRDAVYSDLTPLERAPLHAQAARILRERGAPGAQVAVQLIAAGRTGAPWAADILREAARDADAETAVAALRAALAEAPAAERPGLLVALGQAERGSAPEDGIAHLREGLAGLTEPGQRAEAVVALAYALLLSTRHDDVDRLFAEAGADLGPAAEDVRRQIEAVRLLGLHHGAGDPSGLAMALAHRELPEQPGLGDLMLAGLASAVWSWAAGPVSEVTALAAATLADGRLLRAHNAGVSYAPLIALIDADDPRALDVLRSSFELATESGTMQEVFAARFWYGAAMIRRGQADEALTALAAAREALALTSAPPESRTYADAFLVKAQLARGDLRTARATLDAATRVDPRTDGMRLLDDAELELLAAESDHAAVITAATAFEARHGSWLRSPVQGRRRARHGRALLATGDAAGTVLLEEELVVAREGGAPGAIGAALRDLGQAQGDPELLRDAAAATAGTGAVLEHVRSLIALGGALRRDRRPGEAREPLLDALALATSGGLAGLAAETRAELASMGARPRRSHLRGVASLTPSELRVARLAAEGVSNRDVAQRLYVTPKTVEVHLSSVYRKLGIRTRKELPAVLAEDSPVVRPD